MNSTNSERFAGKYWKLWWKISICLYLRVFFVWRNLKVLCPVHVLTLSNNALNFLRIPSQRFIIPSFMLTFSEHSLSLNSWFKVSEVRSSHVLKNQMATVLLTCTTNDEYSLLDKNDLLEVFHYLFDWGTFARRSSLRYCGTSPPKQTRKCLGSFSTLIPSASAAEMTSLSKGLLRGVLQNCTYPHYKAELQLMKY